MVSRRLFIAIELPLMVLQELEVAIQRLQSSGIIKARFTAVSNLHITLTFLGEFPEDRITCLSEQLAMIAHAPFTAQLGGLDFFARNNRIAIIFAHIIALECVILAQKIDEALSDVVVPEARLFIPHVTLARVKSVADKEELLNFIASYPVTRYSFTIDSFVLKESTFDADGVQHSIVEQFLL